MDENKTETPRAVDIQDKDQDRLQATLDTLNAGIGQANIFLNEISGSLQLELSILYAIRDAITAPPNGQAEPEPIQETLWRIYSGALADHNTLIKIKNAVREPDADDGEGNTIPGRTAVDTLREILDAINILDINTNFDE